MREGSLHSFPARWRTEVKALQPSRSLGIRRRPGRFACGAQRTACISGPRCRRYRRRNWRIIELQRSGRICHTSPERRQHSLAGPSLYPNLSSLPPVLSAKLTLYMIYYDLRRNQVRAKPPQIERDGAILSLTVGRLSGRKPIPGSVPGPFAASACPHRRVGGGRTRVY